ncbi:uncharacterized protein LOC130548902 isoform X2 [Triplophysa rosa]|uniref:uncharacterized protein LOC130548902 isoform X2 n=1 Tax=Triplophysa rosa TaxID=992332 RepID=UPI0025463A0D|nr:uncharacterized protein LOC130548902 isoform X2 [Triplophysa rosa]
MGFNSAIISLILLMNVEDFLTSEPIRVICEHKNICALSDTDVTLRCSYSNISIKTGFWFSHKQSQNWTESDEPEDIALDFDYSGRVKQQITIRQSDLTIRDVRERDSGEYQIMFIMKDGVKHISSVTVHLTVTENQSKEDVQSSEKRTRTQITIVMLSMLLILAVIGVLTYRFLRRRKHNSSQKRDNTKVEVTLHLSPQCLTSHIGLTQKSKTFIIHVLVSSSLTRAHPPPILLYIHQRKMFIMPL